MDSITLLDGFNNTVVWIQQHCWMDSTTLLDGFANADGWIQ